jgi:hypothetical protein
MSTPMQIQADELQVPALNLACTLQRIASQTSCTHPDNVVCGRYEEHDLCDLRNYARWLVKGIEELTGAQL